MRSTTSFGVVFRPQQKWCVFRPIQWCVFRPQQKPTTAGHEGLPQDKILIIVRFRNFWENFVDIFSEKISTTKFPARWWSRGNPPSQRIVPGQNLKSYVSSEIFGKFFSEKISAKFPKKIPARWWSRGNPPLCWTKQNDTVKKIVVVRTITGII